MATRPRSGTLARHGGPNSRSNANGRWRVRSHHPPSRPSSRASRRISLSCIDYPHLRGPLCPSIPPVTGMATLKAITHMGPAPPPATAMSAMPPPPHRAPLRLTRVDSLDRFSLSRAPTCTITSHTSARRRQARQIRHADASRTLLLATP